MTPAPVEYREGATLLVTDFLMRGTNPFSLASHPLMTNNYGLLYNLIVLPFALFWGNTFAVHRSVSIIFILFSSALIVRTLRKSGAALPFSLLGGVLVAACLLFYVTPIARPDALGTFLFLVAVLVPWYRKFDAWGLVFSGVLSLLAFLAKPYFVLSAGIVASFVFLFVSKKRALLYGIGVFGLLVLSLGILNHFLEMYFFDVVINNMSNSALSWGHLWEQLKWYVLICSPGMAILLLMWIGSPKKEGLLPDRLMMKDRLDLIHLDQPFFQASVDYYGYAFLCAALVVVLFLGRHEGAYMTYFFQLITPLFVLVVFRQLDASYRRGALTACLVIANLILVSFYVLYPNSLYSSDKKKWAQIDQYVSSSHALLNSPISVSELVALNRAPIDSGQTEYYYATTPYPDNFLAPSYSVVLAQGRNYLDMIRLNIKNRKYDRIMIRKFDVGYNAPFGYENIIPQYYVRVAEIDAPMPQTNQNWAIEIWEPKQDNNQ